MSLPATDSFTTGSDQTIDTYSANWVLNGRSLMVLAASDDVRPNFFSDDCGAHWHADTFNDAQYSKGVIKALASGTYVGVGARFHASAWTYYLFYTDSTETYVGKYVSGSWTQLGATGGALSASDEIRLDVSGTTITPKRNGSTFTDIGAQTDSSISSGYGGLSGWSNGSGSRIDDWEGGNLGGGGGISIPVVMHHLQQQGIA